MVLYNIDILLFIAYVKTFFLKANVKYNIDILLFIAYVKTFFLKANVKYPTGHLQSKVVYPSRKSSCETVHLRKLA